MDAFILRLQDDYKRVCERLDALEAQTGIYHEHLLDPDEHAAHHAKMAKDAEPKDKRVGERRGGTERRTSTEKYEGEERRAG